jgi:hypothetical protein
MGEHDDDLLREAGFDAAAIAKLRALGVIAGRAPQSPHVDADAGHAV